MAEQADELAYLLKHMITAMSKFAEKLTEEITPEYGEDTARKICRIFGLSYDEVKSIEFFISNLTNLSPAAWKRYLTQVARATIEALGIREFTRRAA